jgi:hypothetical protein
LIAGPDYEYYAGGDGCTQHWIISYELDGGPKRGHGQNTGTQ